MSQRIKIVSSTKKKRVKHREATMPSGEQFEALLNGFRRLKEQGIDIGTEMEAMLQQDNAVRTKYPKTERL